MVFTKLMDRITLKTAEDIRDNPLTEAWIIIEGNAMEGIGLNDLISRHARHVAVILEDWQATGEDIAEEAIAPVRWLCESCINAGYEEEPATTQYAGDNLCQDCADDLRQRDEEQHRVQQILRDIRDE